MAGPQARHDARAALAQPGEQPIGAAPRGVEADDDERPALAPSDEEGIGLVKVREGAEDAGVRAHGGHDLLEHAPALVDGRRGHARDDEQDARGEGRLEPLGERALDARGLAAEDAGRDLEPVVQLARGGNEQDDRSEPDAGDDAATTDDGPAQAGFHSALGATAGRRPAGPPAADLAMSCSRRRARVSGFWALITQKAQTRRYHGGRLWKNSQAFGCARILRA